jgi:L-ascorbate metabolism protein UlaG (beta-lactamase superfamily)
MQLLAAHRPDVALVNIGGHFGMEPAQAAMAAWVARARLVIPHHYKTFPILTKDEGPFLKALQRRLIPAKVMQPGQTLSFTGKDLKP